MSETDDSKPATVAMVRKMIADQCDKNCAFIVDWLKALEIHQMKLVGLQDNCADVVKKCVQTIYRMKELEEKMEEHKKFITKSIFDNQHPPEITGIYNGG